MPTLKQPHPRSAQRGGITILVALLMLVLLTMAAVGMSRNAFREVVSSGFSRQGAMAREVSDSGLDWCVYWISLPNSPLATGNAAQLINEMNTLTQTPTLAGIATDITTGNPYTPGGTLQPGMEVPSPAGTVAGFTVGLTYMGQQDMQGTSQGTGQNAFNPAAGGTTGTNSPAPYLWAIRSDAQVQQGNVTFIHGREAWVTSPVTQ